MTTTIEYALMAGAAYISNRAEINKFPIPQGWNQVSYFPPAASGFEAVTLGNTTTLATSTNIVISFAGTNPYSVDLFANLGLATGAGSDQMLQAVDYYLAVKASAPADANITFTGHSLGGGIAALMGVFFGKQAVTFDQAPFAKTAEQGLLGTASYALDLQTYLIGKTITDPAQNSTRNSMVSDLGSFLSLQQTNRGIPNSDLVSTYRVTGEFTSSGIIGTLLNPIGAPASFIQHGSTNISSFTELHSQALLTAFLQSGDTSTTTSSDHTLGQVTYKITDLLGMIFDKKLFAHATSDKKYENFLEHLVRHEAGVAADPVTGAAAISADAMVTRFTQDLWKIAQDGGLTLNNKHLSDALTAFAMQKYYDETKDSAGYKKTLFTGITGGIQFDIKDVASTPAAAKGYADFRLFLEQYYSSGTTVSPTKDQIIVALSGLRDWYIQAGVDALNATDTQNRNAFMFGDTGNDLLTGGTGNDLLVGNDGADSLVGGAGNDILIGGAGNDTLDGGAGNDTYTIEGRDTIRDSDSLGQIKDKAGNIISGAIQKNTDGTYSYLSDARVGVTLDSNATLTMTLANGDVAVIENFKDGDLGLQLASVATQPTNDVTIYGDIVPTVMNVVFNAYGNPTGTAGEFADILGGTAGNDHILSGALDDNVYGGAGNDWIEGGTGNDFLSGSTGNDLIEGGAGSDIVLGEDGNDLLYGDIKIDTATAIANGNTDSATGIKGDWLAGGAGDDTLVAGAGNDVLSGGEGNDLIIAGAGDDIIFGDGDFRPKFILAATPSYHSVRADWYHTGAEMFNWSVTPQVDGSVLYSPNIENALNHSPAAGNNIIFAGDGADYVFAGDGNDVVYGEGGNDTLYGGLGANYLDGGDGNDLLNSVGNSTLLGGAGNDTLEAVGGGSYLDGGDGNNVLFADGGGNSLFAGAGNDSLSASGGHNYLDGGDGSNLLVSYGGGNSLFTGAGNDTLEATGGGNHLDSGAGDDSLTATGGHNYLDGGDGSNTIVTNGIGGDTLIGGAGNDTLSAQGGGNWLDAGEGNNVLIADGGGNSLYAGAGSDSLTAWGGRNYLDGGDGNNTIVTNGIGGNTLVGGAGNDTLSAQGDGNWLNAGEGNNVLISDGSSNTLIAGAGYDTLSSSGGNGYLDAGSGNDTLLAGGGNNYLDGGDGADVLKGYAGSDTLRGGTGNDTIYTEGNDTIVYNVGDGVDTIIRLDPGAVSMLTYQLGAGIDSAAFKIRKGSLMLDFGNGDAIHINDINHQDVFNSLENCQFKFADGTILTGQDVLARGFDLSGTAADDVITGTNASDRINGLQGNDTLDGGSGNDVLTGGLGNDLLTGGFGSDTYLFNRGDGQDIIVEGGDAASTDTLQFGADILQSDVTITRLWNGDLSFNINGASDQITVQGWYGNQADSNRIERIVFGDGSVLTPVDFENLPINGSMGDDIIIGTSGNDTLIGLAGNDTLDGGAGNDTLIGGAGLDTFMMGYGTGADLVVDSSALGGIVQLKPGVALSDLLAIQQGSDLLLKISGTNDSMLIQSYYTNPQTMWSIQDAAGNTSTPQLVLDEIAQQSKATQAENTFISQTKADYINQFFGYGYTMQANGSLYSQIQLPNIVAQYDTSSVVLGAGNATQTVWSNWSLGWWYASGVQISDSTVSINVVNNISYDPVVQAASNSWGYQTDARWLQMDWVNTSQSSYTSQWGSTTYIDTYQTVTGSVTGVLLNPGNLQTTGAYQQAVLAQYTQNLYTVNIQKINLDTTGQTVYANFNTVVNSNSGNDTIYDAGFAYGGSGNDTMIGGGTLMAGTGNALLIGGNTMISGSGNDQIYAGSGAAIIQIDPATTGTDIIGGAGMDPSQFLNAVYQSMGINDWQISYQYGGMYSFNTEGGRGNYADATIALKELQRVDSYYKNWPLQSALDSGVISYKQPLSVFVQMGGNSIHSSGLIPSAYYAISNTPVVNFSANDFLALAPFFADGALSQHTVTFGQGVVPSDLSYSWGVTVGSISGLASDPQLRYTTLNIAWGTNNQSIQVMIPHSDDQVGAGVSQFTFADGTTLGMAQMIAMAPLAPSFDPQIFQYQAGMGVQVMGAGYNSINFGSGITSSMVTLGLGSLMLRVGNNGDVIHITNFDPLNALASNSIQTFNFADGATLSSDQLLARGFDIYGTTGDQTLSGTNLDNRIYAGTGNDTLIGTGANDTLIAGVGVSTMVGGTGNETFVINNTADVIIANANAASNSVLSSVSYAMSDNVQNLTLTGSDNLTATGNGLDNLIIGNAGNDTLIAGGGNDTLIAGSGIATLVGGNGNDTFVINNAADVIIFDPNAASNSVISSVSYVMPDSVQNLTLTGSDNLTATGNAFNNVIVGNAGYDTLISGAGNDTLIAGTGGGTMIGGTGSDVFVLNSGSGQQTIIDNLKNTGDIIQFGAGITAANSQFMLNGLDLLIAYGTQGDRVLVQGFAPYGATGSYSIGQFQFADGSQGAYTNDGQGNAYLNAYDVNGRLVGDFWQSSDGLHGNDTYNTDGSSSKTTYAADGSYLASTDDGQGNFIETAYNASGVKIGGNWSKSDSSNGSDTFNSDGSSSGTIYDAWGNYSSYINDGHGYVLTTNFDATGSKQNDNWSKADGSYGSDTFNLDGSSSGTSYQTDGSYSTYTNDGLGNIDTSNFGSDGVKVSDTQTYSLGGSQTNYYDINGRQISDSWQSFDGWYGTDTYNVDGSSSGVGYQPDGSYYTYTNDVQGNYNELDYSASGVKIGDYWNKADGSYGNDVFNVDGTSSGASYNVDGSYSNYTNDGNSNVTTTNFDLNGVKLSDSWSKADGSFGSDTFNADGSGHGTWAKLDGSNGSKIYYADGSSSGAWTKPDGSYGNDIFNADGTSSGTSHNVNGSYSSYTNDGHSNVTTTNFDLNNIKLSDSWSNADGTYGSDVFNADGSSSGTSYQTDGSYSCYINDGHGDLSTSNFNINGVKFSDTWNKVDGSYGNDVFNADGSSSGTSHNVNGSYSSYTNDGNSNVTTSNFDLNGVQLSDAWSKADGTYGSDVFNPDGSGSGRTYQVNGSYTNYIKDVNGNMSFSNFDAYGNSLDGYSTTVNDGMGNVTTTNYDIKGNKLSDSWTQANGTTGSDIFSSDGSIEYKVTVTNADGSTYSTDYVNHPNGSYLQSWTKSDGSRSLSSYNAATGEIIASSLVMSAGNSISSDYLQNIGGVNGYNESKASNIYANGTSTFSDYVQNIHGVYGYNETKASSTYADGSSYATDYVQNIGGVYGHNESATTNIYADGSQYNTDYLSYADGSFTQSWNKSDGTAASFTQNTNGSWADSWSHLDGSQGVNAGNNHLLLGSSAIDALTASYGNSLLIGGAGNDTLTTCYGTNIIAFNKGDGQDQLYASSGQNNTLSLGGNFAYSDLALQKSGNDLLLDVGTSDSITFKNWYAGSNNIVNLQVIASAMSDFNPGSADILRSSNVENFDFQKLVNAFDQAQAANPGLNAWGATNALLDAHLAASNSSALGGDLAYVYGSNGNLTGFGVAAAQGSLSNSQFAAAPQTLNPWPVLNTGTAQIR